MSKPVVFTATVQLGAKVVSALPNISETGGKQPGRHWQRAKEVWARLGDKTVGLLTELSGRFVEGSAVCTGDA